MLFSCSSDRFDYARAADGERRNAREPFETDPYGCSHEVLVRCCPPLSARPCGKLVRGYPDVNATCGP